MTRDEAIEVLTQAGQAEDDAFPLLDAAIACAIHDAPLRDPAPVRALADRAAERLAERLIEDSPDEALSETMCSDFRLNGDLLHHDDPANTDIIDIAERRRGLSAALSVFYLDAARRNDLRADGVDFPGHFLLRVETAEGPVALPSDLTPERIRDSFGTPSAIGTTRIRAGSTGAGNASAL